MQPDMLQHLQSLGADARLSIFDDTITKADVSPVAVVAKLATAAKSWQRFKSPDSQDQSSGPHASSAAGEDTPSAAALAELHALRDHADGAKVSRDAADDSHGAASCVPGNSAAADAAAATAAAAGLSSTLLSSHANRGSGNVAGHKVGFAQPDSGRAAEIGAAGDVKDGQEEEVGSDEQQASNADMRAQLAAGIRRCWHTVPYLCAWRAVLHSCSDAVLLDKPSVHCGQHDSLADAVSDRLPD